MNEIMFDSLDALYKRVLPALKSKKKLINKDGFKSIKEDDIWDYMRLYKWKDSTGLELCDVVDDILNTDNVLIMEYYHNKYMPNKEILEDFELPKLKDNK